MGLREYKAKRDFKRTKEPSGTTSTKRSEAGAQFFVVQKHAASRLHYDFRLAMEGVLKSWAVPKGFPTSKGDKRLAVHVEDHPIGYADFEGTIAEGNYGAGTVMVWDRGTYEVSGNHPVQALNDGKLHLTLSGSKLKGEWTLVRMRGRESDKENWLLLKSGNDVKPISKRSDDQSVLTRRTMQHIAHANDAQWQSNRTARTRTALASPSRRSKAAAPKASTGARGKTSRSRRAATANKRVSSLSSDGTAGRRAEEDGAFQRKLAKGQPLSTNSLPKAAPRFVEPMKALLKVDLPRGDDWLYEVKFDGYRALAVKEGAEVKLISRNRKDLGARFTDIVESLGAFPAREAVLDGEVVAVDEQGLPSFQLLQCYNLPGADKPPLLYYVFDVLNLNGRDLTAMPLVRRKAVLESLAPEFPECIRYSAAISASSDRLLREMKARGLEGIIAKRRDSKYETGRRSGAWVKFKWTFEQEFVIGGHTPPAGTRKHFGAILVGYYDAGKLMFSSKVGTGFDMRLLDLLHKKFQSLKRAECPFANLPEKRSGRWGAGLTAAEMRRCTWVEPKLVCQVRFTEWTRDGHLRHPAFLGLRDDKKPGEVVREVPA